MQIERQARSQSYQVEMFSGMETLKAMGCESRAEEHWTNLLLGLHAPTSGHVLYDGADLRELELRID